MRVASNATGLATNLTKEAVAAPGEGPPSPGPKPSDDEMRDEFVKSMISSPGFIDSAMKNLKGGRAVTVSYDGKDLLKITSEGPTTADNVIRGFQKGFRATADVINQYTDTDPLLSLRMAAATVKTTVNTGLPTEVVDFADKAFIPMVRGMSLCVDIPQAVRTFRAKDSTPIDKALEILHVGTDIAGIVGALAPHFSSFAPGLAKYATPMLAVSFAGDALTCGYRALNFARKVNPSSLGLTEQTASVQNYPPARPL